MPLMVWLASAALASAFPIAGWAIWSDAERSKRVARNLADARPTMRDTVLDLPTYQRLLWPVMSRLGDRLGSYTPDGWMKAKALALSKAGWSSRITPEQWLGLKILAALVAFAFLLLRLSANVTFGGILLLFASVVGAYYKPELWLRRAADRRADKIRLALPDTLDQLTISVEAGLGFEAAIQRIGENSNDPLSQEFRRMLQDVRMGTSRINALEAMAQRSQVDDIKTLVLTLRQAETMGSPLAQSLRNLATEMREKRRFRAEEAANKLPVKLIFPLGLCILPALFIVILGPAVIQFVTLF